MWQEKGKVLNSKNVNLKVTVKHGDGSIIVWGWRITARCLDNLYFIQGILDR